MELVAAEEPEALTEEAVDILYEAWCDAAALGVVVMREWHDAQGLAVEDVSGPFGKTAPHFSLIQYETPRVAEESDSDGEGGPPSKVGFVEWKKAPTVAYEVTLDKKNKPVQRVVGKERQKAGEVFREVDNRKGENVIIIPNIGVGFTCGRKKRRPIPDTWLRLRDMWEAALASQSDEGSGRLMPCRRCGEVAEVWGPGSEVSVCSLCFLPGGRRSSHGLPGASRHRRARTRIAETAAGVVYRR